MWTTREVQSHLLFNGWKTRHQLCSLPKGRAPSKAVSVEGTGSTQAILWLLQRLPHLEEGFLNSQVHIGLPFTELWIHEGFQWLLTSLGVCRQNFRVVPDNADGDWGPRSIGEALWPSCLGSTHTLSPKSGHLVAQRVVLDPEHFLPTPEHLNANQESQPTPPGLSPSELSVGGHPWSRCTLGAGRPLGPQEQGREGPVSPCEDGAMPPFPGSWQSCQALSF